MASKRMAEVFHCQPLSENVTIFRLKNVAGGRFPEYKAGQNIALYRNNVEMTFSIASAPAETKKKGYLEFFVSLDNVISDGDLMSYADHASGNFTLERAEGFSSVIFVATGTGVAPFVSMIRELANESQRKTRYTLIHGSRKSMELGYHKELSALANAAKLDLLYIPTISRPSAADWEMLSIGKGRAGNLLRQIFHLPHKGDAVLPDGFKEKEYKDRFHRRSTIILACGSHASVADIRNVAAEKRIRFEKEDW